jgi:hypothetical protein
MKSFKNIFSFGTFVAIGFLASACGKPNVTYSTKAATTAASAATSSTPTMLEGQWQQCTSGTLLIYAFAKNGYSVENDYYTSSDCSDSGPNTIEVVDSGTFQLGAAPQANSGTTTSITFTPGPNSTIGTPYSGNVINLGSSIGLFIGNNPMLMLRNVNAGSGLVASDNS